MKKNGIFSLLFAIALLLSFPLVKADAATTFKDVENGHWSSEQSKRSFEAGIITGFEDGTFRPTVELTREEAAIMLSRALNLDTSNVEKVNYKDVDDKRYAYKYIAAVTEAKLMEGYNGEFFPTDSLTRQDMAVVIQRAFKLQGNGEVPFTDVTENYAYDAISALYANDITTGYADNTFKPKNNITREEFVVFIDRALNTNTTPEPTQTMANYLKEVYANEAALTSYEFEGSMNLGLVLPKLAEEDAELAAIFAMFEDIDVSMTGAYQLDPMLFKANVAVTLNGDFKELVGELGIESITIDIPMIMTEDKMWMKFPQTPFAPVPEEFAGKYIEFDMAELSALSGQPAPTMNMNLQTEFGIAIQSLFIDHFAKDFYKEVSKAEIGFGNNNDVEKVVKFELSNETLASFIDILFNKFMPDFIELLNTPGYAEALGLTAEDLALMQESLPELVGLDIEEMVSEINNFVKINELTQYDAIHKDKYILSTLANIDVEFVDGEESFGFKLAFDLNKLNVNKPVQIKIPDKSQVVPFESLFQFDEEFYYDEEVESDI